MADEVGLKTSLGPEVDALGERIVTEFRETETGRRLLRTVESVIDSEVRGNPTLLQSQPDEIEAFLRKRVDRELSLLSAPGTKAKLPAFVDSWIDEKVGSEKQALNHIVNRQKQRRVSSHKPSNVNLAATLMTARPSSRPGRQPTRPVSDGILKHNSNSTAVEAPVNKSSDPRTPSSVNQWGGNW